MKIRLMWFSSLYVKEVDSNEVRVQVVVCDSGLDNLWLSMVWVGCQMLNSFRNRWFNRQWAHKLI